MLRAGHSVDLENSTAEYKDQILALSIADFTTSSILCVALPLLLIGTTSRSKLL